MGGGFSRLATWPDWGGTITYCVRDRKAGEQAFSGTMSDNNRMWRLGRLRPSPTILCCRTWAWRLTNRSGASLCSAGDEDRVDRVGAACASPAPTRPTYPECPLLCRVREDQRVPSWRGKGERRGHGAEGSRANGARQTGEGSGVFHRLRAAPCPGRKRGGVLEQGGVRKSEPGRGSGGAPPAGGSGEAAPDCLALADRQGVARCSSGRCRRCMDGRSGLLLLGPG